MYDVEMVSLQLQEEEMVIDEGERILLPVGDRSKGKFDLMI